MTVFRQSEVARGFLGAPALEAFIMNFREVERSAPHPDCAAGELCKKHFLLLVFWSREPADMSWAPYMPWVLW